MQLFPHCAATVRWQTMSNTSWRLWHNVFYGLSSCQSSFFT